MKTSSNKFKSKIRITVNGEPFSCYRGITITNLLEYLDFDLKKVILEYNSNVINDEEIKNTNLKEKYDIEIITIVGGG
uniref:thiamine biosynthesis protein S n=1 Tax=Erythrolobus coxiae TaxID=362235 RepID=UPI001FCCD363|nr:thiamine biosynthesis protein S [Erythrolobus coxiae]UNJ17715.1 thiamine biosynthesis protein S [Erythrolobus coxiae]